MININLLPPELKLKRIENKKNASLVSICLVVFFIFVVIGVVGKSTESTLKANLANIQSDIEKNNTLTEEDQKTEQIALLINDRWQATQEIDQDKVSWSQVIQDLNNSVPEGIQFENITATTEKTPNFILQGNTTNEREIIKFKEKLENSIFFKNVEFKSSSLKQNTEAGTESLSFTLEFDLEQKGASTSTEKQIK